MTPTPTLLAKLTVEEIDPAIARIKTARRIYVIHERVVPKHIVAVRSDGSLWCARHTEDPNCEGCRVVTEFVGERELIEREEACGCGWLRCDDCDRDGEGAEA